jgi:tetraacyldisaccharide 4'-kinase
MLPAGPLREPAAACRYADILVVTRSSEEPSTVGRNAARPIFHAHTKLIGFQRFGPEPDTKDLSDLGPGPFLAFCGIGNPAAFFDDLSRWRVAIAEKRVFPDHHKYSSMELDQLQSRAVACGATGLVTTEKDAENFPMTNVRFPIWIVVIELVIDAEGELLAAIDRKLTTRQGAAA